MGEQRLKRDELLHTTHTPSRPPLVPGHMRSYVPARRGQHGAAQPWAARLHVIPAGRPYLSGPLCYAAAAVRLSKLRGFHSNLGGWRSQTPAASFARSVASYSAAAAQSRLTEAETCGGRRLPTSVRPLSRQRKQFSPTTPSTRRQGIERTSRASQAESRRGSLTPARRIRHRK